MINFGPISNVLGVLLIIIGCMMFTGIPFSLYFESNDASHLFYSGGVTILAGLLLWLYKFKTGNKINKREGYLIVTLGWLSMVTFSTLPYLFSGTIDNFTDAFFEVMSGMTTTGASVLNDIEATPEGILYWRSMTQWIGGMGIIVLTVAIFPLLGIGGIELFVAEAPGPTSDKIHPRIQETAKRLWLLYVGLTATLMFILWGMGMTFYEAINHAYATLSTGGFSTKNGSMMDFDLPRIQYPIIFFMFIGGINYSVIYHSLKGNWKNVWSSDEFKAYIGLVGLLTIIVTATVFNVTDLGFEKSFRDSLFQIVSVITTTGFVSADYTSWTGSLTMLFLILMFVGACAGSTSGGIKLIRHLVFFRNSALEFKKILHPQAVIPLKLNGQTVDAKVRTHIMTFLLLYLMIFVLGVIIVSVMGLDFKTAIGAVATTLGNVGPGLGQVGPVDNFAWLSPQIKWFLCLLMLLGRLELFSVLVLFTPYFWREN